MTMKMRRIETVSKTTLFLIEYDSERYKNSFLSIGVAFAKIKRFFKCSGARKSRKNSEIINMKHRSKKISKIRKFVIYSVEL